MLLSLFFVLLAASCFYVLTHDEGATGFIVAIGFLQDPARKLMAGEPVYMTILVGVLIGCIVLRQVMIAQQSLSEPFLRWSQELDAPIKIYLILIFLQGVHSYIRYGSVFLTGLGAIFYLAPLVAIVVGYSQFDRYAVVRQFLLTYSAFAILVAATVVMSFSGTQSPLFGEVGEGLVIYDQGTILKAYSGLMRSSEVAAWHMGAGICFLIVLVSDRGSLRSIVLVSLAVILLMGAIVLTGRRKMILQILIFAGIFVPLLQYFQGRLSVRFGLVCVFALSALWFLATWYIPAEGTYDLYFARGASVFGDASERFSSLGLGSVRNAIREYGVLGGGLGVATQGAQHFFSGVQSNAGEGGLGKLISELGVVSLVIVGWLAIAIAMYLHSCLTLIHSTTPNRLPFVIGIGAFIASNVPTFIVASQVYGDVFVLTLLGLLSGVLFAAPRLVIAELSAQSPAQPSAQVQVA